MKILESLIELPNAPFPEIAQESERVHVFVKTLTGKAISFEIALDSSVYDLKAKIQDMETVPIQQQRVISKGRLIEENYLTLKELRKLNRCDPNGTFHLVTLMAPDRLVLDEVDLRMQVRLNRAI